jgi:hypothetical protein
MLKAMSESLSTFASTYKDKTSKQVCTGGYNAKITFPMMLLMRKLPVTLSNSIIVQKHL